MSDEAGDTEPQATTATSTAEAPAPAKEAATAAPTGEDAAAPPMPSFKFSDFPGDESLDGNEFDPVAFINTIFPTEQSLANLDPVVAKIKYKVRALDEDVLDAIRLQASSGDQGQRDLDDGKNAVKDLFAKIAEIKRKAEDSERMVKEICQDITRLDHAKKNLMATITTLNHLKLLVDGVDQLQNMTDKRQYATVANLLEATNALSVNFDSDNIPTLVAINSVIKDTRVVLEKQIRDEIRSALTAPENEVDLMIGQLAEACLVVDALGEKFTDDVIGMFVDKYITEYRAEYNATAPDWGLAKADKRYQWLDKTIAAYELRWEAVFPEEWKVDEKLCEAFCQTTRKDLDKILEDELNQDTVAPFLSILQLTLNVEHALARRFVVEREKEVGELLEESDSDDDEELIGLTGAERVRAKYQRHLKRQKRKEELEKGPIMVRVEAEKFHGMISCCFEPYMNIYIDVEDKNLTELIDRVEREEVWRPAEENESLRWATEVYQGSADLIIYFRKSTKRCATLTKGQALFDLHKTFKRHLENYCLVLQSHIPGIVALNAPNAMLEAQIKMDGNDEKVVCRVINTAVYLTEGIQQMQETFSDRIDEVFSDHIDFSDEMRNFNQLVGRAVMALVVATCSRATPILTNMTKLPWATWDNVGDESSYVAELSLVIGHSVPDLRASLNPMYFRRFCDKFASTFIPRYVRAAFSVRRISEIGAEQLLLDVTAIKNVLLEFPNLEARTAAQPPRGYANIVRKEIGRMETLLKVMLSSPDSIVDSFSALVPDGTRDELQRLMELKGMKKSEITATLNAFLPPDGGAGGTSEPAAAATASSAAFAGTREAGGFAELSQASVANVKKLMNFDRFKIGKGGDEADKA